MFSEGRGTTCDFSVVNMSLLIKPFLLHPLLSPLSLRRLRLAGCPEMFSTADPAGLRSSGWRWRCNIFPAVPYLRSSPGKPNNRDSVVQTRRFQKFYPGLLSGLVPPLVLIPE